MPPQNTDTYGQGAMTMSLYEISKIAAKNRKMLDTVKDIGKEL